MKLMIGSLDDLSLPVVEAHYNPKEVDLAKQATWKDEMTVRAAKGDERWDLSFTGNPARTMALELVFDGYEIPQSIEPIIETLQTLASPIDAASSNERLRRPHVCVVVWDGGEFPRFQCVIESVNVKYTMFSKTGTPLRATCQVKLKEIKPDFNKKALSSTPKYVAPRREDLDKHMRDRRWVVDRDKPD